MRRSFKECVEFALAVELLLVVMGETMPVTEHVLPLGGSHLKQIGALVGLAIALHAIRHFFGPASRASGSDAGPVSRPPHAAVGRRSAPERQAASGQSTDTNCERSRAPVGGMAATAPEPREVADGPVAAPNTRLETAP